MTTEEKERRDAERKKRHDENPSHRNGKGWAMKGKNRSRRNRLNDAFLAKMERRTEFRHDPGTVVK